MQHQDSIPLDSPRGPVPTFWAALTAIFSRKPVSSSSIESTPQPLPVAPLPPAPQIPPTPQFLKLPKGEGTILRKALNPDAPSGEESQKVAMMEMPSPSSFVPTILLQPARTFLQASRTMLSAFRKTPPPRPVTSEPAAASNHAPQIRHLTPETRFENKDFPIV